MTLRDARPGDLSMPRHVLVTGADGKIGTAVTAALLDAGVLVTGLSSTWRGDVPYRAVTGDVTDEADVFEALTDVDAVVHLAALAHPSAGTPYEVYRTNTDGTFNVLTQAGQRGVSRAVIASSINASGLPLNHHGPLPAYYPIDERIPHALDDWYSLSKLSDELTAEMAASRWGMTVIALRFPSVPRRDEVSLVAGRAGPQEVREGWSYLLLEDAARAVLRALVAAVSGAAVIGLAADHTYMEVETEALLDAHAPDVPRRRAIPGRTCAVDTTRARELLGFRPSDAVDP